MAGGVPWTKTWLTFDNTYYSKADESDRDPELFWPDTDKCIHVDPEFKKTFDIYATDQNKFFQDFAKAHKKLTELGAKWEPSQGIKLD